MNIKLIININDPIDEDIKYHDKFLDSLQNIFNLCLEKLFHQIRDNNKNVFLLNSSERKVKNIVEDRLDKLYEAILPIMNISDNPDLINISTRFFKQEKEEFEKKNSGLMKLLQDKKNNLFDEDFNEYKKIEKIQNLLDDHCSDSKIYEFIKKRLDNLIKNRLKSFLKPSNSIK